MNVTIPKFAYNYTAPKLELNDGQFFWATTSTDSRMVFEIVCLSDLRRLRTGITQHEEHFRLFDYGTSSLAHRCYETLGAPVFFRFFCAHTSINKCIVCKIFCLSNGHKLRIEGTQEWEQIRFVMGYE